MKYRKLGKTGFDVSEVSLGTWQVGGKWGENFDEKNAEKILNAAIDQGVNFIDTADVYSNGLSEKSVAKVVKSRSENIYIATKCGRRTQPHTVEAFSPEKLVGFVEDSLRNMKLETLDLIQFHCPPSEIYDRPEYFETFDKLRQDGKIRNLGVSVEKVNEALKALEYPNVTSVQIIFNMFRLKPAEEFFQKAANQNVGIIARVPLASGMLTGKFNKNTNFGKEDHRNFNRNGEAFDKGETFSGIEYEKGLQAVEKLQEIFAARPETLTNIALKWVLMHPEVSTVIAGASRPEQALENAKASEITDLNKHEMQKVKEVYDTYFRKEVHTQW
ncbi:aldo/keto reductase [Catalinimonas niigatensis]|uniref:aldo/keto reductase n=1 Tax=Catalinimonas niigatensis TaxID=1397264 RepID=UPI002664E94C|nr:aldo/keto reductase [Catalinimonas niigatensis]WPP50584.1 aldo/keto reductase [Catalinimonas niigatensis]